MVDTILKKMAFSVPLLKRGPFVSPIATHFAYHGV